MVETIVLNKKEIEVIHYEEENIDGSLCVTVDFEVTSEDYHDVTVLLYEGTFDVHVPKKKLSFRGTIYRYATSITNLFELLHLHFLRNVKIEDGDSCEHRRNRQLLSRLCP